VDVLVTARAHAPEIAGRLGFASLDEAAGLGFAAQVIDANPRVVVHLGDESETLLGALTHVPNLEHLVIRSDLAVHGTGARMPSIISADAASPLPSTKMERVLRRMEADVHAFVEERPAVTVTLLRLAPILGDGGSMSRYLGRPAVPSILGFDPRLQLLHIDDAASAFKHAVTDRLEGTFDVAAQGQLYLSRIVRLGGRRLRPLPEPLFRRLAPDLGLSEHLVDLLKYGRVVESTFEVAHSCRDTLIDFYGTWKNSSID
jgi:UDP-glucose 4-epimerase